MGDGAIDASQPEALIYEPSAAGLKLWESNTLSTRGVDGDAQPVRRCSKGKSSSWLTLRTGSA